LSAGPKPHGRPTTLAGDEPAATPEAGGAVVEIEPFDHYTMVVVE